jgi:hypothetical protein
MDEMVSCDYCILASHVAEESSVLKNIGFAFSIILRQPSTSGKFPELDVVSGRVPWQYCVVSDSRLWVSRLFSLSLWQQSVLLLCAP